MLKFSGAYQCLIFQRIKAHILNNPKYQLYDLCQLEALKSKSKLRVILFSYLMQKHFKLKSRRFVGNDGDSFAVLSNYIIYHPKSDQNTRARYTNYCCFCFVLNIVEILG